VESIFTSLETTHEISVLQHLTLVFMYGTDNNSKVMDQEYSESLRQLITRMGGVPVAVVFEVP